MSKLTNLEELFEHLLQDMYYAENQITKSLPKMIKKATNPKLQSCFEDHLEETKGQVKKLEKVFEICGLEKEREKCEAMDGLMEEGDGLMQESKAGAVLDSAMIAAAQKIEHYEIASYGTLCNIANQLGEKEASKHLHEILEQEKATDVKLSKLSDSIEEQAMKKSA